MWARARARQYPGHNISSAVTPECRWSSKVANLRALFPAFPPAPPEGRTDNEQGADLQRMMQAEVLIADVGSFSAWIAYLRALLFEGVSHVPMMDHEPRRRGRAWDGSFDHVPALFVDSHQHAALVRRDTYAACSGPGAPAMRARARPA